MKKCAIQIRLRGNIMEWTRDDYILTDDKEVIDLDAVHDMLSRTYWVKDRPKEIIKATIEGSL